MKTLWWRWCYPRFLSCYTQIRSSVLLLYHTPPILSTSPTSNPSLPYINHKTHTRTHNSNTWNLASSTMSPLTHFVLTLVLLFCNIIVHAHKEAFRAQDVLPLLPRQVAWPILNSLNSAVDLLPTFVGAASMNNNSSGWKGACFYENNAWMEFHNKSGSQFGGGTLHLKVQFLFISSWYPLVFRMVLFSF